jgi:hypothetical protein
MGTSTDQGAAVDLGSSTDQLTTLISEEILRERVKNILQDGKRTSSWAGIFSHPLTAVVVGFVLTGVVGFFLSWSFNEKAKERDRIYNAREREIAEAKIFSEASVKAVQDFSRAVYARHTRAMMLLSSLRRKAPPEELRERKKLYDEAFVDWGVNQQANLLEIRRLTKSIRFTSFENTVEKRFMPLLTNLDNCLTKAYDESTRKGTPDSILGSCKANELLNETLNEGYDLTNSLYEYVAEEIQRTGTPNLVGSDG